MSKTLWSQYSKVLFLFAAMAFCITAKAEIQKVILSGSVKSTDKSPVDFATVYLKDTNFGCTTDEKGEYRLNAPAGNYTLVVSAIGFETYEKSIIIGSHNSKHKITLKPSVTELDEVVVVSNGVSRLKRSAFNAVAVDTRELQNSTKNLSEALQKLPGMKLRESGGVGSDMQLMLDGFSGKHVKVFIDGVPQEGAGTAFDLNNIPVNFAERIEVYKGVVPVGFGSDALGGVINIWNLSAFGKYYNAYSEGTVQISENNVGNDTRVSQKVSSFGYGAAGAYFIGKDLQLKLSYEKALRMPTTQELFGDGDLEAGKANLKPERSNNVNLNASYNRQFGKHGLYVEGGIIYRNTKDYIKRDLSTVGGTSYGNYTNHGKVETKGYNVSLRYSFAKWFNMGGTFNNLDIRDKEKKRAASSGQNALTHGQRMPNVPYRYANIDANFTWHDLFAKGNTLTLGWDFFYQHEFPLYWESFGHSSTKIRVPEQLSHNISLGYSIRNGRYNISFECRNLTDEKLYDNFSLQKAGRAFISSASNTMTARRAREDATILTHKMFLRRNTAIHSTVSPHTEHGATM